MVVFPKHASPCGIPADVMGMKREMAGVLERHNFVIFLIAQLLSSWSCFLQPNWMFGGIVIANLTSCNLGLEIAITIDRPPYTLSARSATSPSYAGASSGVALNHHCADRFVVDPALAGWGPWNVDFQLPRQLCRWKLRDLRSHHYLDNFSGNLFLWQKMTIPPSWLNHGLIYEPIVTSLPGWPGLPSAGPEALNQETLLGSYGGTQAAHIVTTGYEFPGSWRQNGKMPKSSKSNISCVSKHQLLGIRNEQQTQPYTLYIYI